MRIKGLIFALSFLFLLSHSYLIGAEEEISPLPISGFSEKAAFKLFINESQIGTIQYTLTAEGAYERKFILALAGQKAEYALHVRTNDKGVWEEMIFTDPTETATLKREKDHAILTLKNKGETHSVSLQDKHLLYDNYGPVFESFMLKQYDRDKKGKQVFPRFIAPVRTTDVELEYKGRESRRIGEKEMIFWRFDFTIMGIAVEVWADEESRIYMMNVPVQYAAFVREGFEELLDIRTADPSISKPEHEVLKKTEMIPMRDGVKLAADLYFPKGEDQKWPVILVRTPYKKEMEELKGEFYARRGYVTAIQDCRGRFSSEGTWEPFLNEPRDGYDTIEWLGTQEWSNGKVGMIGASYVGWVQLWAASEKPPHLATIIPNVAPPDPFYNIPYEYGTFFILGAIWWAEILEREATGDLSGKTMAEINERKYEEILKSLPVIDLDKKILGKENPYWRKWIQHNTNDAYWEKANFMAKLKGLDIPVFLQSGWFDGDGIGSKLNYAALKESRNKFQKLILGPWGHSDRSHSRVGDHDFGKEAALDLQTLYLKWFDRWLKGVDTQITEDPLVQVFVMFSNKWLKGNTYPLPETQFTKFFLSSTKGANTSKGDGRLCRALPEGGREFDQYTYDPGDPTPSPQFYFKSEEEIRQEKEKILDVEEQKKKAQAFHNKVTDSRADILVFQTDPLEDPLSIAGPVSAVLYASSSAKDTDWFVTFMDVDEEGKIFHLTHGTLRARFRNSIKKPEFLEKGKIYPFTIDMWQTGITFRKGHRIRIEVSSALFPQFSRNLNTGGHNEMETESVKADQKIYHSEEFPSHILLPVVKVD